MSDDAEFQAEIVAEFLTEAGEVLARLERDLVAVDGGRDPGEVVANTFRAFHTLKGTSGFLGFAHIGGLAHAAEDLLSAIRDGAVTWTRPVTDLLLEALDALRAMVEEAAATSKDGEADHADLVRRLRAQADATAAPPAPTPAPPAASGAVPAPARPAVPAPLFAPRGPEPKLTRRAPAAVPTPGPTPIQAAPPPPTPVPAAVQAGSAAPAPAAAAPPAPPPASPPRTAPGGPARRAEGGDHGGESGTLRVPVSVLDRLMNLVGELVLARNQLIAQEALREDAALTETSQRIHHLTTGLQEAVMKARMQPIDTVFSRLPRVARDAAQATGKQARLVTAGAETELDKTLLEAIKDPLTHVVRNSVDHGLEKPAGRAAAGKPAEGTVTVRAFHDGGQVVVEVEDDGAGVNLERVKQKAVSNGIVTAEQAAALSDTEAVELLFRPGFSTAEAVTQISGRGVGMDVVRTNVERIGGSVELESYAGHGTTVRMRVPLTLVIVPSLIVSSGGERYAIPQASLVELVRIAPEREAAMVVDVQGTQVLRLRGNLLPLVDLGVVLRTRASARADDGGRSIVVLATAGQRFGLLVDEVADTEETVVKPLGRQLQALGVYSGATVRGDGRVALVLDVLGLARRSRVLGDATERARLAGAAQAGAGVPRRPYLVLRGRDDGRLAVLLDEVTRLEELDTATVERVGGTEAVQYRGSILPLVRLSAALPERRQASRVAAPAPADGERLHVVVYQHEGRQVGLVVDSVLDVVEESATLDAARARAGVLGCAVIQGRITEVLDTGRVLAAGLAGGEVTHG
jgi:two-component system chemotaxis sensor kinase CheA